MVGQIFLTELLKLRRTKITWVSLIAIAIMPMVGGLFTWIAKDPARAADLGLMGQKAQFIGVTADWPSFFLLILQTMGVAGMILVSVIAVYVFGREYTEQTAKNLLALPVGRHWFVIAKLGVVALWFAVLVGFLIAWSLVVGWLVGMPGFSLDLAVTASADLFLAASVGWLLVPAVAWVSAVGRGYMAPLVFTFFMLLVGNVLGATGWGKWFPWSIVPLYSGVAGPRVETLAPGSIGVLVAAFVAGTLGIIWQLRHADNVQ